LFLLTGCFWPARVVRLTARGERGWLD